MKKKFHVGLLSDQVQGNFAAHVQTIESFETIEAAHVFANQEHERQEQQLRDREDFGEGAIIGHSVVISNGYKLL